LSIFLVYWVYILYLSCLLSIYLVFILSTEYLSCIYLVYWVFILYLSCLLSIYLVFILFGDKKEKLQVTRVVSQSLCWGCDPDPPVHIPDYLILANCVYYEGSLECLLQTVLELTNQRTKVLACYEERSPEIKKLIGRWHEMVRRHFNIREVDPSLYHSKYAVSYVRIVTFERLEATEDTSH